MRASIVIVSALAISAGVARADGPPGETSPADAAPAATPPAPRPSWMWTVGAMLRATGRDDRAAADIGALQAYGYEAEAATLKGLRGDIAYLNVPIVDLGVAWAWGQGTYGAGPGYDDPDQITGSTLELGVLARVHWVKPGSPVAAEPRVEVGIARTSVGLRGSSLERLGTYTRFGIDARAGARKAGVMLSVDYTSVNDGSGDDQMMAVPTGGLTFAVSFYWRHWP